MRNLRDIIFWVGLALALIVPGCLIAQKELRKAESLQEHHAHQKALAMDQHGDKISQRGYDLRQVGNKRPR